LDSVAPAAAGAADAAHAGEAADAAQASPASGRHRAPEDKPSEAKSGVPHSRREAAELREQEPKRKFRRAAADIGFVVVAALVLSFLLKTFLIQSFYIPSGSMEPTFQLNDRVLVTKLAPKLLDLHRGDVVVFRDPNHWVAQTNQDSRNPLVRALHKAAEVVGLAPSSSDEYLIKRVIGLPGDRVACGGSGQPVTVNGVAISEPYIAAGAAPSEEAFDVVVPDGAIWVMGDNRDHSADSRKHQSEALGGAVALSNVVGVAQLRTWPLSRLGVLKNPADVFAAVPDPVAKESQ
jgi:signal peptidase I